VGDIIAFQDSDDAWMPDKLERQLEYMKKMACDVVACPYIQIMDGIERQIPSAWQISRAEEVGVREVLRECSVVCTPTLVMKRKVVENVGYFDESMPRLQDYEYAIRISEKYTIGMIPIPLGYCYIGEDNISKNPIALQQAYGRLLSKHRDFLNIEGFIKNNRGGLLSVVQEDPSKISEMGELYANGNLQDKLDFYENFIKALVYDFSSIKKLNDLHKELNDLRNEYQLKRLKNKKFVIYGAGEVGKYVFAKLKKNGLIPLNFIVTKLDMPQEVGGVEVIEAEELVDKDIMVVVAVSDKYQKQVLPYLDKLGLKNWICF
jgi:hypothetical protein